MLPWWPSVAGRSFEESALACWAWWQWPTASHQSLVIRERSGCPEASQAFQAKTKEGRLKRAEQELDSLKPSRPVSELEALIAAAANQCRVAVSNGYRQTVCTKPPALLPRLGRAKRRAELEAILAEATGIGVAAPVADPGATSIATYLVAVGITLSPERISTWLNLIPVLGSRTRKRTGCCLGHEFWAES